MSFMVSPALGMVLGKEQGCLKCLLNERCCGKIWVLAKFLITLKQGLAVFNPLSAFESKLTGTQLLFLCL